MNLIKIETRIPYNPKLKDKTKDLRKNMTEPEKILWY
jgi:very-short-patch-repair endonuclease